MTDVTLSAATQSALLLTKRTTALAARISERIVTELRVTRAAGQVSAGRPARIGPVRWSRLGPDRQQEAPWSIDGWDGPA